MRIQNIKVIFPWCFNIFASVNFVKFFLSEQLKAEKFCFIHGESVLCCSALTVTFHDGKAEHRRNIKTP